MPSSIARYPSKSNTGGEAEVGDLAGVQVYNFRVGSLLCLLVYRVLDENTVKLLMVGPHENFYRDLRRTEH